MKKFIWMVIVFAVIGYAGSAQAMGKVSKKNLVEEEVTYTVEGLTLKGFFVYDKTIEGKRPGVIVVHEWWGHNDYARDRARKLAQMGYAAFALDMFGDGKTAEHPQQAQEFISAVMGDMRGVGMVRFMAAMDALKQKDVVDPERIAAIGYCFGGGVVLHMARMGVDLDAVASFHGGLSTIRPAITGEVKPEIMVFNGAADPYVPAMQVEDFTMEMETAGASFQVVNYEGVKHGFTNPGATKLGKQFDMPLEYNKEADMDSWAKTAELLQRAFAK